MPKVASGYLFTDGPMAWAAPSKWLPSLLSKSLPFRLARTATRELHQDELLNVVTLARHLRPCGAPDV